MTILFFILLGASFFLYLLTMPFRHFVNLVIMFLLKTPLSIVKFIDRKTCPHFYPQKMPSVPPYPSTPMQTQSIIINHYSKRSEPTAKPEHESIEVETYQKPQGISTFKTPDGKQHLMVDENEIDKWLKKNPELKIDN